MMCSSRSAHQTGIPTMKLYESQTQRDKYQPNDNLSSGIDPEA